MEYAEIKKIIKEMEETKFEEVSIEFPDGTKIALKKEHKKPERPPMPQYMGMPQMFMNENVSPTVVSESRELLSVKGEEKKEEEKEDYKIVKSPMVGTYYGKPSPNAENFVEVGKKVKKGDILCIIEAMKLMNEIESEFDGEVVEVLVNDGDMVDFGKPLFKIK